MKDLGILTTTVSGGFGVIIGYVYLYLNNYLKPLAKKFKPLEWKIWSLSALLTIASFLALIIWFSSYQKLEDYKRDLFYSGLTVFLVGAIFWSLVVFYIMKFKKSKRYQLLPLTITTTGSILILFSVFYSTDNPLLIIAASILVFHHLIFDNLYWPMIDSR